MTDHTTALDAIAEQLQRIADALSTPASPAADEDDDPPVACWHTEPGTTCDWDVCRQPERLAAEDRGTDPATTPPVRPACVPDHAATNHCPGCTWDRDHPTPAAEIDRLTAELEDAEKRADGFRTERDKARHERDVIAADLATAERLRAEAQATLDRVRRLAQYARDRTEVGESDWAIGQHELAVAVLDILDSPAETEPPAT